MLEETLCFKIITNHKTVIISKELILPNVGLLYYEKLTCNGSSRTPEHIGQTSSSSTSPLNLPTSKPIPNKNLKIYFRLKKRKGLHKTTFESFSINVKQR